MTAIREAYPRSERQACKLAGVAVSSYRYQAQGSQKDEALRARLTALALEYPRFEPTGTDREPTGTNRQTDRKPTEQPAGTA